MKWPGFITATLLATTLALSTLVPSGKAAGPDALPPQLDRLQPWQRPQVCGANLLYVLLKAKGVEIGRDEVVQLLSPPARGSSIEELSSLARKYDVFLKPVRGTSSGIGQLTVPWIAHLEGDGQVDHFLLVLAVNRNDITVLDGSNLQTFDVGKESFFQRWTGSALVLDQGLAPVLVRSTLIGSAILCVVVLLTKLQRHLKRRRSTEA